MGNTQPKLTPNEKRNKIIDDIQHVVSSDSMPHLAAINSDLLYIYNDIEQLQNLLDVYELYFNNYETRKINETEYENFVNNINRKILNDYNRLLREQQKQKQKLQNNSQNNSQNNLQNGGNLQLQNKHLINEMFEILND